MNEEAIGILVFAVVLTVGLGGLALIMTSLHL